VIERPTERQLPIEGSSGFRLLVVSGPRAETFSLPASGEVAIGRGSDCQVQIDDARLSRLHATLVIARELVLRDMGSSNGCYVGGRHLAPHESIAIAPGVVILLGGATLVVQRGHASTRLRHVRSHDYFEARVEDECARAEASKGTFSVARIRCRPKTATRTEAVLSRWLRPMDVVALYAPNEYEILLVDTAPKSAEQLCDAIVHELAEAAVGFAVCAYPQDARSPEGLARALAADAANESPAVAPVSSHGPDLALVARGTISVLLLGETGVGKEVAANAIHRQSARAKEPLVSINCASFSESLLESELFGHERGAFTGAHKTRIGLIESADGGTFFLDEVGEMPPSLQVKLLRVLEHKQVMRIGAVRPRSVDVRFIAATNRDLEQEVARGAFRRDLYYRLAATTVMIPPLRERREEIVGLANHFITQTSANEGKTPPRLTTEAREILEAYAWPGNIRELRNVIERAVLLCRDGRIRAAHVPTEKMGRTLPPVVARPLAATVPDESSPELAAESTPVPASASWSTFPPEGTPRAEEDPENGRLGHRDSVISALAQCAGNQTQAARVLGMSRRTLVKRLEEFALPRPRKQSP
jgi:DNA-binding NtrC family response regulator